MKRLSLRFNPNDPGFEVYDPVTGALLLRLLYVLPLAEQGDVYQLRSPQGELLGSGSMMTTLLNDFFASEVDVQFVY